MIRNHSLNNIKLIFWPAASVIDECAHLSRQWNSEFDVFCSQAHVAYKCKTNKVQSVDQADLSRECLIHVINWKEKILKERLTLILQQESNLDSYDHLITSKFSDIKWGIRMTSENVANLKIELQLTLADERFWWHCYSIKKVHCHDISVISKDYDQKLCCLRRFEQYHIKHNRFLNFKCWEH